MKKTLYVKIICLVLISWYAQDSKGAHAAPHKISDPTQVGVLTRMGNTVANATRRFIGKPEFHYEPTTPEQHISSANHLTLNIKKQFETTDSEGKTTTTKLQNINTYYSDNAKYPKKTIEFLKQADLNKHENIILAEKTKEFFETYLTEVVKEHNSTTDPISKQNIADAKKHISEIDGLISKQKPTPTPKPKPAPKPRSKAGSINTTHPKPTQPVTHPKLFSADPKDWDLSDMPTDRTATYNDYKSYFDNNTNLIKNITNLNTTTIGQDIKNMETQLINLKEVQNFITEYKRQLINEMLTKSNGTLQQRNTDLDNLLIKIDQDISSIQTTLSNKIKEIKNRFTKNTTGIETHVIKPAQPLIKTQKAKITFKDAPKFSKQNIAREQSVELESTGDLIKDLEKFNEDIDKVSDPITTNNTLNLLHQLQTKINKEKTTLTTEQMHMYNDTLLHILTKGSNYITDKSSDLIKAGSPETIRLSEVQEIINAYYIQSLRRALDQDVTNTTPEDLLANLKTISDAQRFSKVESSYVTPELEANEHGEAGEIMKRIANVQDKSASMAIAVRRTLNFIRKHPVGTAVTVSVLAIIIGNVLDQALQ